MAWKPAELLTDRTSLDHDSGKKKNNNNVFDFTKFIYLCSGIKMLFYSILYGLTSNTTFLS